MDLTTRKERSDMILEPLQSYGSISIIITITYWDQGIGIAIIYCNYILLLGQELGDGGIRMGKMIYTIYLSTIRRYYKWYKSEDNRIYNHILTSAVKGIEKLIVTYSTSEQTAITHTLALYKNVLELEAPDLFKDPGEDSINIDTVFQNIKEIYDKRLLKIIYNTILMLEDDETTDDLKPYYISGLLKILNPTNRKYSQMD